jgi:hypothetical protein
VGVDRPLPRSGRLQRASGHSRQRRRDESLPEGTLPFPDGAILAKLAWKQEPSTEFDGAFVPGRATTVQIMVKDSKKYASTGGWGFGRFIDGKPVDRAQHETCFGCHQAHVKDHDLVFTRFVQ